MGANFAEVLEQAGSRLLPSFGPHRAEAQRQNEFAFARHEVDLSRACDVAVLGSRIFPFHLEMLRDVLPAVGRADKSDGHLPPRCRRSQPQRGAIVLGEKHGESFVVAGPARIAVSAVRQMRREQGKQSIIGQHTLQRFKTNLLQHHVAIGIAEYLFVNAISARNVSVGQLVHRDAGFAGTVFERAMPLFFRKEFAPVGHDESHIACAGLIHARKVDFIENAVAQRKPDFAVLIERRADAGFSA